MKKILKYLPLIGVIRLIQQFRVAYAEGRFLATISLFSALFIKHRRKLHEEFLLLQRSFYKRDLERERKALLGLHSLLAKESPISYSILIFVEKIGAPGLEETMKSAFLIPAPVVEVICNLPEKEASAFQERYPFFTSKGGKINVSPSNSQLLLLSAGELPKPEILYRYEQIYRTASNPSMVLYTKSTLVNRHLQLISIEDPLFEKEIRYPYQFAPLHFRGLLIPREFFSKLDQRGDIGLQLDLMGAHFWGSAVPLLYVMEGTFPINASRPFLEDFRNYVRHKKLGWDVEEGLLPNTVRAIPPLSHRPKVFAILPFKDQKEMTLICAKKLMSSHEVDVLIVAVDNGSLDPTIAEELKTFGAKVIRVEEPFNYSRLNNIAAMNLDAARPDDLLLFINNDAWLEPEAILEMVRWTSQKEVGIVGMLLLYPDGTIQHGGVENLEREGEDNFLVHSEMGLPYDKSAKSRLMRHTSAVTAASALMRYSLFQEIGGFEEILYPNAFSDTSLEKKILHQGYLCLYTPYARGVHHESKSRIAGFLEEFDRSKTLDLFFASTFDK